jgi:hypothetical protein
MGSPIVAAAFPGPQVAQKTKPSCPPPLWCLDACALPPQHGHPPVLPSITYPQTSLLWNGVTYSTTDIVLVVSTGTCTYVSLLIIKAAAPCPPQVQHKRDLVGSVSQTFPQTLRYSKPIAG